MTEPPTPLRRTPYPDPAPQIRCRGGWPLRLLVPVLCLAIGWFDGWTQRSNGEPWEFGTEQRDYYNLLIDGYLDGQLHMKVAVPEALLRLPDPYDPQLRPPGLGLHDASFYRGRYYVYFGVAPMVTLMLPFRLLTGMDLPLGVAILFFVYAGFLVSVALFMGMRRRYFSETSVVTVLLGVLVLGLAGPGGVLLRRPDMWELPIAGGYCFAMLTLALIWRSLHSERGRACWFAAAGLALGLAIASRPTYLFGAPLLIAPVLWWWRQGRRPPWRLALSAVVPLAVVGALMAGHNYARFDDPLQFGQAYQFSLDYESKLPHFRAAYVPFTVKAHFFSPAQWSFYFPFIQRADLGPAPEGFTAHRGDVYGILANFPIAWLALAAPLALWRRSANERGPLGAWLASVTALFVLTTGVLLCFFSALARYQMDFAPALMLLACVGLLGLERWMEQVGSALGRAIVRLIWMSAAAFSVVFGLLLSLQFDGVFRENNPRLERELARRLNRILAVAERVIGVQHGAIEMNLRIPGGARSQSETLLTAGAAPFVDRVIVRYPDDGRVQFGVVPHGSPEQLSRPLSFDRAATHRVRVTMGSLFPRGSHPYFAATSPGEIQRITRQLRIEVDGEPVLVGHHRSAESVAGEAQVGAEAEVDPQYPRFRGSISNVRRLGRENLVATGMTGPFVRLRLTFNQTGDGACEPLVSMGDSRAGVLLTAKRIAAGRVRFGFRRRGGETVESPAIEMDLRRSHELVLRFEITGPTKPGRMLLWRDAELVWAPTIQWDGGNRETFTPGKNRIGAPDCGAEFRGTIHSAEHDGEGRDPIVGPGDLRVKLRLPRDASDQREPLVVTGRSGSGDMCVIEYVDAETVRFGWDHWGTAMVFSEPIRIDFAQPHTLDIGMGSLQTVANARLARAATAESITVTLDGRRIWEHSGIFFPAEDAEVFVGRNPIGGTSCAAHFSGEIFSAGRIPRE